MGLVMACLWYLVTAGATFVVLTCGAAAMAIVGSYYLQGYDVTFSFGDAQWIMLCLLVHDRFVGPYSQLLRKVAKKLSAAKSRNNEDRVYDR